MGIRPTIKVSAFTRRLRVPAEAMLAPGWTDRARQYPDLTESGVGGFEGVLVLWASESPEDTTRWQMTRKTTDL